MRRKCPILTVLVSCGVLLLQIGCQPDSTITGKPGTTLVQPAATTRPTEAQTTKHKPQKKGPRITFEEAIHNLGEVGPGTKNVCRFKFKNTGDATLKIKKVSKTCSCTPYSLAKREYAPGENGVIKITYNASSFEGSVTKRLYVYSNDRKKSQVGLTIKAKVALKVRHEPGLLKLSLKQENAGCPKITLTSADSQPFAIKSFKAPRNCITASFDSSVEATKFVLEPKVDVEKLKKNLKGRIRIAVTHPKCKLVTVSFDVLPRFKITPSSTITARNAEPQKPIPRQVWILNNYDEDFEIESTSSEKNIIRVLGKKKLGKRYKLELQIVPPVTKGKRRIFSDVLHVNIKGDEELKVRCNGFYPGPKKKSPRTDKT